MKSLFISPHNDDEALFGAFAIMRFEADLIVVYDSFVQPARGHDQCTANVRRQETLDAMCFLRPKERGHEARILFGGLDDRLRFGAREVVERIADRLHEAGMEFRDYDQVFSPLWEPEGHPQHNRVCEAACLITDGTPEKHRQYATYTSAGKSTYGQRCNPTGAETIRKLRALCCYRSQIELDDCRPHFIRSQEEYLS